MSTSGLGQLSALQKANTDLAANLMRPTINGVERLSQLNLRMTRDLLDCAANNAQQIIAATTPSEFAKLNGSLAQPALTKCAEYSRNVYELVSSFQKEISSVLQTQYSDFSKSASAKLDQTRSAPGGDIFAAVFKTMLDASSRSMAQANAFAKQATQIAEVNLQAAATTVTPKTAQ